MNTDKLIQYLCKIAYKVKFLGWFIFRPEGRGAYVAVWVGDEVLMIKNSYKKTYTLPSGGIKRKEDYRQAALRELREETGVEAELKSLQHYKDYVGYKEYKKDHCKIFELKLDSKPEIKVDNREVVWGDFIKFHNIQDLDLFYITGDYFKDKANEIS